jgi:hypothetical protein
MSRLELDWQSWLAGAKDLDAVQKAVIRERVIRQTMADSQESREVVTVMVDSFQSMSEEAVQELTEGEPTTLRDAISRYIEMMEGSEDDVVIGRDVVAGDLLDIINFPWSGEEALVQLHETNPSVRLEIEEYPENDRDLIVKIGGHEVARISWEETGSGGMAVAEHIATVVHRAVLARVIPDRDHHVQLTASDRRAMLAWLERPNGAWQPDSPSRVSLNAVEGGGVIVRTWPYRWMTFPKNRA